MVANQQLVEELEETFRAELDERLEAMNGALLEIERGAAGPRLRDLVGSLFRDAHSLKGGAQLVGRDELAALAHSAETYLGGVLRSSTDISGVELRPLFAAVDAMGRLAAGGASLSDEELHDVITAVQAGRAEEVSVPRVAESRPAAEVTEPDVTTTADGTPSAPPGVRVSAERLDAVLSRSGDLIGARDTALRQQRQIQALADELGARQHQWTELASAARRLARELPDGPLRRFLGEVESVQEELAGPERRARGAAGEARVATQRFAQLVDQLEAELRDLRMVPAARLFRQFPRMVRDVGHALGKPVQLHAVGWDTPIDRELLERLKDPVMHLLRNAVDHGIEPADERRRRQKPAIGSVTLAARREGDRIVIEVRDDGGGIDLEGVVERAGVMETPGEERVGGERALRLIFRPGLSTLDAPSVVSGRGVGLDVVATEVRSLGGTIDVSSDATGTAFMLRLPLTLISTRVLVARAGGHRYAIPIDAIQRVVRFDSDAIKSRGGAQTVRVRSRELVVADLAGALGHSATRFEGSRRLIGLVVDAAGDSIVVVVEAVEGEREVVVKPLGAPIARTAVIAGAALVDQDDVLLVLDQAGLVASAVGGATVVASAQPVADGPRQAERPLRVLVADDSITTRTLEKNILAAAGFDVALAADGREALRTARIEAFDLVVSDVDMPGMDGVELTQRLRADAATRELPVILVTAKERPEDRERGLQAGADAYLLKSEFDQQALLKTIREVVG